MADPYERDLPGGTRRITTGCQYCAVGCGYNVLLRGNGTTLEPVGGIPSVVTPAMRGRVSFNGEPREAAVLPDPRCDLNRGNHSVRGGSQGHNLVHPPGAEHASTRDRLTTPQIRGADGELREVTWDTALAVMARLVAAATDAAPVDGEAKLEFRSPEGLGVKVFEYQYLENTYAATKLFYSAIGTPNVAYHDRPSAAGSSPGLYDAGFRPHDFSYDDVRAADIVVLIGTNPYENHSVFFMQHCTGRRLIVIDPRRTATADYALRTGGVHLQPKHLGADPVLLYALARAIIERHGPGFAPHLPQISRDIDQDRAALPDQRAVDRRRRRRVTDFDGFRAFLANDTYTLDSAEAISGIPRSELEGVVATLAPAALPDGPKVAVLYEKGLIWGFNYHNTAAVASLGLVLGSVGGHGRLTGRVGGHQKGWATCKENLATTFVSSRIADPDYAEGYPERNATDEYVERDLAHLPPHLRNARYRVRHNLDNHVFGPPADQVVDAWSDAAGDEYVALENGLRTRRQPDVRLLWIIGGNYLGQTNDAQRKREQLRERLGKGSLDGAPARPDFTAGNVDVDSLAQPFIDRMRAGGLVTVHQEIFANPTTDLCDIVLPASGWGEDTFCRYNAERRLKLYERFQDPPRHDGDNHGRHSPRSDWRIFAEVARELGRATGGDAVAGAVAGHFNWRSSGDVADEMALHSNRASSLGLRHLVEVADRLGIPAEAGRVHTMLGKGGNGIATHLRDHYEMPTASGRHAGVYRNGVATNGVHLPLRLGADGKLHGSLRVPRLVAQPEAKEKLYFVLAYWDEIADVYERLRRGDDEVHITNGRFNHLWNNMFHHIRNEYTLDRYPADMPGTIVEINPAWAARQTPPIRSGDVVEIAAPGQDGGRFLGLASLQDSVQDGGAFALFSYPAGDGDRFAAYVNNLTDGYQDGINPIAALKYGKATIRSTGRSWSSAGRPGPSYAPRNRITAGHGSAPADWPIRELIVQRGLPRAERHFDGEVRSLLRDPDGMLEKLGPGGAHRRRFVRGAGTFMEWTAENALIDAWDRVDTALVQRWAAAGSGQPGPPSGPQPDNGPLSAVGTVDHSDQPTNRPSTSRTGGRGVAERKIYRIHPGVGIARMGTSASYFVGPEAPTLSFRPEPGGNYRDDHGLLKRQAQRFRIYELTYPEGADTPSQTRQVSSAEAEIRWSVHVANTKSFDSSQSQRFAIDPGPVTLGPNVLSAEAEGELWGETIRLASLRREEGGELLVLGSLGRSGHLAGRPIMGLRSPGWWDDEADGWVRAWLRFPDGTEAVAEPAWVVVSVPAYAAPVENLVTLYDLAIDHAVRSGQMQLPQRPSFTADIYPLLRRTAEMRWVSRMARAGHGAGSGGDFLAALATLASDRPDHLPARDRVWQRLKENGGNMPRLTMLDLTEAQYQLLQAWRDGDFVADWQGPPAYPAFDAIAESDRPAALDRAALESIVGGSFNPGIEVCNVVEDGGTWGAPCRIRRTMRPGGLTRELAVPWQADFVLCGTGWWPGGRPNEVSNNGSSFYRWLNMSTEELLNQWSELGFLKRQAGGEILEDERLLP